MISDGYKAFVNKSDVASVVKEYVAIIAVGISGVGNGKLCSQLNTAISFDEAMYLFEGMWLFLVRPAWAQSRGLKSLTRPSSGKCIA